MTTQQHKPTTEERIAEIRARLSKATKAPWSHAPDDLAFLLAEVDRLRAALPASVVDAMAGTEGDAEGCFDVAMAAASRCEFDTPEGRVQDAVSVAANGLRALALLTAEPEQSR